MVDYADRLRTAMDDAGISITRLASDLGISYQAVRKVLTGGSAAFSAANTINAARVLGVSAAWLATGIGAKAASEPGASAAIPIDLENNPDYPAIRRVVLKLSAGADGYGVEYSQDDDAPIVFQRQWFARHHYDPTALVAVRVINGSMEPGLHDGDTVVINTTDTELADGVVFAVNYEGDLVVKRLVRDAGQWWLSSDNPDKARYPRKICTDSTRIIGRIVHKQSERI